MLFLLVLVNKKNWNPPQIFISNQNNDILVKILIDILLRALIAMDIKDIYLFLILILFQKVNIICQVFTLVII